MQVAVIGNGPSLGHKLLGTQIDACDVVIRMNAYSTEEGWAARVGSRTDVYATYAEPWPPLLDKLVGIKSIWWVIIGSVKHVLEPRGKHWLPWCADNGVAFKTIPDETVARAFAELGITAHERAAFDKKPTTGVVTLLYALESYPDATVYAAGFDGYKDGEPAYYWRETGVAEHEIRKIALDKQRAWFAQVVASGRVRLFDA